MAVMTEERWAEISETVRACRVREPMILFLETFEHAKELRASLEKLLDVQNGPPLIRHEKEWQAAVDEAERLLGRKVAPVPQESAEAKLLAELDANPAKKTRWIASHGVTAYLDLAQKVRVDT